MKISSFSPSLRDQGDVLKNSILYKITHNEYNQDEKLKGLDPKHLFISNIDGSALRRLTPENKDLLSYSILSKSNQRLFETQKDLNLDKKFNSEDELTWHSLDLAIDSEPE
ncbi:MAG: hypothetical protein ACI888_000939 [Flavobacteriales bacterium]|jgi:hypothetical protein|tara:strand:+ start:148 stop:480 length:333 start_codon:yes stop_codon:yes gene_type:complete